MIITRNNIFSISRKKITSTTTFFRKKKLYHVLAIESSCDDSSVCLINRNPEIGKNELIDHITESLDSSDVGGIVPTDAKSHHQAHIGPIVQKIMKKNNLNKVDLVCATRGPGMMGSLSAGFNVAKGLSIAWGVPMIGVHHMLGHLLTPRFFTNSESPKYPFISLLVSGGHTMLVLSKGILDHRILANTVDIAIGDMLDKCARELGLKGSMLGKELENLVMTKTDNSSLEGFPEDLKFPNPLYNQHGRVNMPAFSFAPFISAVKRASNVHFNNELTAIPENFKIEFGKQIQSAIFNHLTSKVLLSLNQTHERGDINLGDPLDFVASGGVASNQFLRQSLQEKLPGKLQYHFPDPKWCTDNALMIGWAGIELWENARLHTDLAALNKAKWPIDQIMSLDCWLNRDDGQLK